MRALPARVPPLLSGPAAERGSRGEWTRSGVGQASSLLNIVAEGARAWMFKLPFAAMPFIHGAVFVFEM